NKVYMKIMPASNLVAQLQTGEIQMNSMPIGLIPIQDFEKVKNMTNVTVESACRQNQPCWSITPRCLRMPRPDRLSLIRSTEI
ncbi:hypothetical protein, partial [Paenibacillus ihuae]|uniref:hypothetical protein n=1 Tax=Paenibacillus ihuae TaxID=1232431 RepID=UPI001FD7AFA5